jgi:hypothetical protein
MDHRVKPLKIRFRQVAYVFADLRDFRNLFPEVAARKQVCVQTHNLMAGRTQNGLRDGPDIASMSS